MARTDTLGNFLTDVADAIRSKTGNSDPIVASNFDAEISNISTGASVHSIGDFNDQFDANLLALDDYMYNLPNSYDTYTTNAVTLYTPSSSTPKYFIRKNRNNGQLNIVWVPDTVFLVDAGNNVTTENFIGSSTYVGPQNMHYSGSQYYRITHYRVNVEYYSSSGYDTLEEVLEAIQSPNTTYTSGNSSSFNKQWYNETRMLAFTNIAVTNSDITYQNEMRISSNETIAVIE